jgi:hypothetical protein
MVELLGVVLACCLASAISEENRNRERREREGRKEKELDERETGGQSDCTVKSFFKLFLFLSQ